ncbi:MAG: hypothetical protein K2I70_04000, partial [Bacilli bacterium]|nr:hypothetical protein [Bacilli bacterium]
MFCTNCGHQRQENEEFCLNCGIRFTNNSEREIRDECESFEDINVDNNNFSQKTFAESLANSPINSYILKKRERFLVFLSRNKKKGCIFLSILVVIFLFCLLYESIIGFEKFSWNKNYNDYNLDYVTQANIKLGINFSKEQELDKIKYKTTCGDISNNKLEIIWNLQDATGKCVIEASYKMKKIKKEYNVIPKDIDNKELALDYNIDLDDDDDLDFDGLTNKQEREYKTNPLLYDSDMDGLSDYDEIIKYKTDPNKKDTDDDGISDYDEIKLGLDPLKKDSKGDGVSDGERTLTFAYKSDKLQMNIKGKGNIASTEVDITTNTKISGKKGLIDKLYSFYTEGKLSEALLTITYDDDDLIKYGLNEDNLTIFYYNEKDLKYEKVDTILNKENKTLTTTLKHFSKYVVGDSSLTKEKIDTEILFILDNSWSMYTNEQYEEITGKDTLNNSFDGSDSTGSRFSLTSDLISKLAKKDYKIGLSEFRNDYANALKIGSDEKDLKEKLEQMNGKFITSIAGTNIN